MGEAISNKPYFTIIVPVYNVAKYLNVCVDSILRQSYKSFEVLLIDDGSTDGSSDICNQYAGKYKYISVIHRENGGLSAARNTGLEYAKGKYVLFVDSDDYIADHTLQTFFDETYNSEIDIVAAYGYKFSEENGIEPGLEFRKGLDGTVSGNDFFSNSLYQGKFTAGAPYYLTSISIIKDNGLLFGEGLLHEDELWTPILLLHAKSIIDLKFRFYYYRKDNLTSITRNPDKACKRAFDRIKISHELAKIADNRKIEMNGAFGDNLAAHYMYAVFIGKLYKMRDFNINRTFPLRYSRTVKYKLKALLFCISPKVACMIRKKIERLLNNK